MECAAPLYDPANNTIYKNYSVNNAFLSMVPPTVNPNRFNLGISYSGDTFTLNSTEVCFFLYITCFVIELYNIFFI